MFTLPFATPAIHAIQAESLPAAVVDMSAFDANIATFCDAIHRRDFTIRIATKSIRVPALIRRIQDVGGDRIRGLMTFAAAETELLADHGFDDFLLAYPVATSHDADLLAGISARGKLLRVTVDHADQLPLLSDAAGTAGTTLRLCIDVDMSTRLPLVGHVGVRRSPLQSVDAVLELARAIEHTPHLQLDSVLGYEAQVAGLPDANPRNQPLLDPIRRRIKALSIPELQERRAAVVQGLRNAGFPVGLVNGGGSGSLHSTLADPVVTEITVGSGFMATALFDHYQHLPLQPALYFALPVTRHPAPGFITCSGGGYIASGPPALDRTPVVVHPPGLAPLDMEGWGEVQTPFRVAPGSPTPPIGDIVWCRPAKAGELAERFASYLLAWPDDRVESAPTYRGLGSTFT